MGMAERHPIFTFIYFYIFFCIQQPHESGGKHIAKRENVRREQHTCIILPSSVRFDVRGERKKKNSMTDLA